MLVTFKSSSTADITMFGDVAKQLLKLMGQSGEIPGAILADDVAGALATLKDGLSHLMPADDAATKGDDDDDAPISLSLRANPLMKLLEEAADEKADVIWE